MPSGDYNLLYIEKHTHPILVVSTEDRYWMLMLFKYMYTFSFCLVYSRCNGIKSVRFGLRRLLKSFTSSKYICRHGGCSVKIIYYFVCIFRVIKMT